MILAAALAAAPALSGEPVNFSRDVRPLLERSCFGCHGPEKQKSGYRVDRRRDAFKGGDSGDAAIHPHDAKASPLIRFVSGEDPELFMPPKKSDAPPLTPAETATLRAWVDAGAPWPDAAAGEEADARRAHWAWQPLVHSPLPKSTHANPIDAFISAKLAEKGLTPAPEADGATLIRRLYFDLHGLAPNPDEVEAFAANRDPHAFEKLVDRLLASPRYGERWARHWFDAIHFADTHGFEHDLIRPNAWRYRDYVITALNADTPWPRFVREQLAADALFPEEPRLTAALGFLGAGPFDSSAANTAPKMFEAADRDDLIVQTMAAFTSTTVGCARCHDHKFDPIPQSDYYALAAVFAGVAKGDVTYDEDAATGLTRRRWQEVSRAVQSSDRTVLLGDEAQRWAAAWESARGAPAEWAVLTADEVTSEGGATIERKEDGSLLSTGARPDKETLTITAIARSAKVTAVRLELLPDDLLPMRGPGRQENGNVHTSEFDLHVIEAAGARRLPFRRAAADFDQTGLPIGHAIDGKENTDWGIHPRVGEAHVGVFELAEPLTISGEARLRVVIKQRYGQGHVSGRLRLSVTGDAPVRALPLPTEVDSALRVPAAQRDEAQRLLLAAHAARIRAADELAQLPAQVAVYSSAREVSQDGKKITLAEPREVRVLRRGDLGSPAEPAAPGALSCIDQLPARFALADAKSESARRAALAAWITDSANPLTWRSIVNRVWQGHFGQGLVNTPNDLGHMGGVPSHRELLDWLAADFRDSGGSLKRLHRLIVTSAAYRRSSAGETPGDADNRLLARFTRQRLDAESFRDIVLQTAGRLDLQMGGPSVMHFKLGPPIQSTPVLDYTAFDWDQPGANRRAIYRLVYRNIADPFMTALDFPDAAQLAPTRPFSASALQALALWNDAFVLRHSAHLAARAEAVGTDLPAHVRAAVRLTLLREPKAEELRNFTAFAEKRGLAALCRVLFNSNEFLFVN